MTRRSFVSLAFESVSDTHSLFGRQWVTRRSCSYALRREFILLGALRSARNAFKSLWFQLLWLVFYAVAVGAMRYAAHRNKLLT